MLLALVAGGLAGCSNLAIVLPRAALGEPPLRTPEETGPTHTRIASSLTAFRLRNGLEVVLVEDRARPRFALSLRFPTATDGETRAPVEFLAEARLARLCRTRAGDALEPRLERGVVLSAGCGREHATLSATGPASELEPLLAELATRLATDSLPAGPGRPTLVLAGDFEPARTRARLEESFAGVVWPERGEASPPPAPSPLPTSPVVTHSAREDAQLTLLWRAPAERAPGAAELEMLATILAEGPAARLEERLVLDRRLAREVAAGREASALGPAFHITAVVAHAQDLAPARHEILATLTALATGGPSAAEFERARARAEARFLARMQDLLARAEAVQGYLREFGQPDGFERDLARWTRATPEGVRAAAGFLLDSARAEFHDLAAAEPVTEDAACDAPPPSRTTGSAHPARPDAF